MLEENRAEGQIYKSQSKKFNEHLKNLNPIHKDFLNFLQH